ncbi:hypothetical protein LXD69_11465 [Flavobacterium sediminilitoris]|uniref:YD repeat-containing protein n=1 Tax=Flavobacterium sediminilitoris TaxID=2024526 RepID=A0ABY4HJ30_9FLAO|nr:MULTISPECIES: hypothetical protein [Flavobacterium]UOX32661.1 hypothetical protein LXD69_11465 [Flavobacterium sediminilitoris]
MKTIFKNLVIFILSLTFIKCSSQKENVNENWGGGIDCNYPGISQNLKGPIKRIIQYKVINRTGKYEEKVYKNFFSFREHDHDYILAQGVLQYDKKGLIPGSYEMYGNGENNMEYDSLVPKFLKSIDTTVSPFPDNWLRDTIGIQEKYNYKPKYSYKHYMGGDLYKLQLNRYKIYEWEEFDRTDFDEYVNWYIIDEKGGRIKENRFYMCDSIYRQKWEKFPLQQEKTKYKDLKEEDWDETTFYKYDDKDRIIELTYAMAEQSLRSQSFDYVNLGISREPKVNFKYNNNNRVTEEIVSCIDPEDESKRIAVQTKKFTYHPTKGYLEKQEIFIDNRFKDELYRRFLNDTTIITYNEHEDITSKKYKHEFLPPPGKRGLVSHNNDKYYKYEYDKYGNWTKCYMYLTNDIDTPTIIATRIFEYYKD